MGRADQRGADDRASHGRAARGGRHPSRSNGTGKRRECLMTVSVSSDKNIDQAATPWQGFHGGLGQKEINVRDFIQQNYDPYDGDGSFLRPATPRTGQIWDT